MFLHKKKVKGKTASYQIKLSFIDHQMLYFIAFIFEFLHIDRSMFNSCLVKQGIYIFFFHKNTLGWWQLYCKLQNALNLITASCVKTCVPVFRVRFHFLKHGLIKHV